MCLDLKVRLDWNDLGFTVLLYALRAERETRHDKMCVVCVVTDAMLIV